jgi:hypothetical protein
MKSKSDPNMYIKIDQMGNISLIFLYVDDLIITCNVYNLIKEIKRQLSWVFEMTIFIGI